MVRKRNGEEQERVHVWLYTSDWKELKSMYEDTIGPSKFVRLVVRRALRSVQERANGKRPPMDTSNIDTELDTMESDGS